MLNNGLFNQALATALTEAGKLSQTQAAALLLEAGQQGLSFTQLLQRSNCVSSACLALETARQLGYPCADMKSFPAAAANVHTDCVQLARYKLHQILPLWQNHSHIAVAFADPASLGAIDDLRVRSGLQTEPIVVDALLLKARLELLAEGGDATSHTTDGDEQPHNIDTDTDAPVVRFVDRILLQGIRQRVSDIHLEPGESSCRVRYRKDGLLQDAEQLPAHLASPVSSRLKVMADLDITERRRPQDGRLRFRSAGGAAADMRISSIPTVWGEKLVLRLLTRTTAPQTAEQLGMLPCQQTLWQQALDNPQGMILVTGPTGSGKSNTLYSALCSLNTTERNIFTVEDPVENMVEGINQVSVNNAAGLTFGSALRAFMRQDPDVIMLGEIRDHETADMAVKAAQTGHLLLSTLHTNSAAETITRLINMGVASYNLSDALRLIVAQRLCRRLCIHCRRPAPTDHNLLKRAGLSTQQIDQATLFLPTGCSHCHQGFAGRVGIFELLPVTASTAELFSASNAAHRLREHCQAQGLINLRQAGLCKVALGITTLAELDRICQ